MIADLLTRAMLNRGYQVRSVDERESVFARTAEGAAGAMLSGSETSDVPEARVRFSVADVKGGAHITAVIQFVTNPDTKYEHASLPNGGEDFAKVQEVLAAIRDRVARRSAQAKAEEPKKAKDQPKAKKSEPLPDDRPTPKAAGDDDTIERMRKRVLGSK